MKKLPIILFLLCPTFIYSQSVKISGTVKDSLNKGIPFVNIYSEESKDGTLTNENGEFEMNVQQLPIKLIFSHVSYQTISAVITNNKPINFFLKESTKTLPEVKVGNYAFELIKKAIDKINADSVYNHFGRGFYRKIQTEGNKYTVLHEMFFNANLNGRYGFDAWQPTASRYTNHDGNVESQGIVYASLRNSAPNPRVRFWNEKGMILTSSEIEKYYQFNVENFINEDSPNEIAVIVCTPKKNYITAFTGKIYVKTATNGILKVIGRRGLMNSWPSNFWFKVKESYVEMDINYREDENQASVLTGMDLNFINMVQYASAVGRKVADHVNIIMYDYDDAKEGEKEKLSPEGGTEKQIFSTTQTSPEFWANNPILKRTPIEENIIQTFEKRKNKGGNMFPANK